MITAESEELYKRAESTSRDHQTSGAGILTAGTIRNWVVGPIHSCYQGLVRAGVRIRIGQRTDVRVKRPADEPRSFIAGQRAIAIIPADAVRLEAGIFRRSRQRSNRWVGRIV